MRISDWSSDVCSSDLCHCEESLRHSLDFTPANAGNMALAADITAAAVCWPSRQGDPTTFFHLVLKNPLTRQIRWKTQITPRFFCKWRNLSPKSKYALQSPPPDHHADLIFQLKLLFRHRNSTGSAGWRPSE